jgi:hypothetical protein
MRLPSALSANSPIVPSMLAASEISPPPTGTEKMSLSGAA